HLDAIGAECALKPTTAPGGGRALAAEAVREGFEIIVAAGGDGTLNEVLNGIGDEPDGFARARLGVLPLGTINVFAREIGMPLDLRRAWAVIRRGRESAIDLPQVEFGATGKSQRRWFAQLAGAGRGEPCAPAVGDSSRAGCTNQAAPGIFRRNPSR